MLEKTCKQTTGIGPRQIDGDNKTSRPFIKTKDVLNIILTSFTEKHTFLLYLFLVLR